MDWCPKLACLLKTKRQTICSVYWDTANALMVSTLNTNNINIQWNHFLLYLLLWGFMVVQKCQLASCLYLSSLCLCYFLPQSKLRWVTWGDPVTRDVFECECRWLCVCGAAINWWLCGVWPRLRRKTAGTNSSRRRLQETLWYQKLKTRPHAGKYTPPVMCSNLCKKPRIRECRQETASFPWLCYTLSAVRF